MKPASPILPGVSLPETVYAKDQPEYMPLPAYRTEEGIVLSRWHMTWRERVTALLHGDVYLWVHTYGHPLQPVQMQVQMPNYGAQHQVSGKGSHG